MDSKVPAFLFKALTVSEWESFQKTGVFDGSELDKKDGFIHTSTEIQLPVTLKKFFPVDAVAQGAVIIVKIDTSKIKPEIIKYEPSKPGKVGGELYYHIYGSLKVEDVCVVV